jgi:hypothetical protein
MMRRQRGVTMIGWIFLLIPMAVVLYAAIRVGPEYLNYWKVVTAMKETASEFKADEAVAPNPIRAALAKRFDVGYIDNPDANDIQIAKGENGIEMTADYEKTVPLFGNLFLTLTFKRTVAVN